ncbi:amidohydrolase family protein [Nakamurella sp. YIM 132087]|uniref:Amidohydrolase family protein n=1 Tax=Nakamurella alba TaxID=2665158 RepID=A0A7K1FMI2_9ACTN|nr:amidohydrolase family protein [Nakamurella alba]MTD14443.1 amidohydrolase family protein [Nakamurella alba]
MPASVVDIHQHLWPDSLVDLLRSRSTMPYLRGWSLSLPGEPVFEVTPTDHDVTARQALDADVALIGLSLSSPLGIEYLPTDEATPLIEAWHSGATALPDPFRTWAAVGLQDPDLDGLARTLADPAVIGLQVPATALGAPAAVEAIAPVLRVCELADRPVLVHPGPVPAGDRSDLPGWWPAVVDYPAQLTAAWWAWQAVGRSLLPDLRICFAAGAGLAPVHHERFTTRGGGPFRIDPLTFVEVSSYGPRAVDALVRVLGIDVIVHGTDRPYAGPVDLALGDAGMYAVRVTNPTRLLEGGQP